MRFLGIGKGSKPTAEEKAKAERRTWIEAHLRAEAAKQSPPRVVTEEEIETLVIRGSVLDFFALPEAYGPDKWDRAGDILCAVGAVLQFLVLLPFTPLISIIRAIRGDL